MASCFFILLFLSSCVFFLWRLLGEILALVSPPASPSSSPSPSSLSSLLPSTPSPSLDIAAVSRPFAHVHRSSATSPSPSPSPSSGFPGRSCHHRRPRASVSAAPRLAADRFLFLLRSVADSPIASTLLIFRHRRLSSFSGVVSTVARIRRSIFCHCRHRCRSWSSAIAADLHPLASLRRSLTFVGVPCLARSSAGRPSAAAVTRGRRFPRLVFLQFFCLPLGVGRFADAIKRKKAVTGSLEIAPLVDGGGSSKRPQSSRDVAPASAPGFRGSSFGGSTPDFPFLCIYPRS